MSRVARLVAICVAGLLTLPLLAPAQDVVDLRPRLEPVKHQGERGTCSVHAATCLMEFLIRARTGSPIDLSEAHNYWVGKHLALTNDFLRETYSNMDGLAGFLAVEAYQYASMLESEWPYEPRNWQQNGDSRCTAAGEQPTTECFTGVPPVHARLLPYRLKPFFIDRGKLGEFLLTHRTPIVFNIAWYPAAVDNRTGAIRMPSRQEQRERFGHVILLVGFDARSRQFVYRSSWGPEWGDRGYGTVPEAFLVEHCEVAPSLRHLEQYSPEQRAFVLKASQGASGQLVEVAPPDR